MAVWRMAFRSGNQGPSVWPQCLRLGVAAITYPPIADIDLLEYPEYEPHDKWRQLSGAQNKSLARVAYSMRTGDLIYVKEGTSIVGKGIVLARPGQRAYQFDRSARIVDLGGEVWRHQVPVKWASDFNPVRCLIGTSQQFVVQEIAPRDVARVELLCHPSETADPAANSHLEFLSDESYYRECPERLNVIVRAHNRLSNAFCRWLNRRHGAEASQERNQIDIEFKCRSKTVMAELKVCFGTGTRKAIREALGQVLEYNHYSDRTPRDLWLIVLDEQPNAVDLEYVQQLREQYRFPLFLGWQYRQGFQFSPDWPDKVEL